MSIVRYLHIHSKDLRAVIIFVLCLTVVDVAAQWVFTAPPSLQNLSAIRIVVVTLIGAISAILILFLFRFANRKQTILNHQSRLTTNVAAVLISISSSLIWFLRYWPVAAMNDTWAILNDPWGISAQHPLTYGVLLKVLVNTGSLLTHYSLSKGLAFAALFQIILWALMLLFLVDTLCLLETPNWVRWFVIIVMTGSPVIVNYSYSLVKDAPFVWALVMTSIVFLRIFITRGKELNKFWFCLVALISFLSLATLRNNGFYVLILIGFIAIVFSSKSRVRSAIIVVSSILLALVPMQLSSHVAGKHLYKEKMGIPLQMVGYAMSYNSQCFPKKQYEYFNNVMSIEGWKKYYTPRSVDPIKDSGELKDSWLQAHKKDFIPNIVKAVPYCNREFTKGYLLHTSEYWRVDALNVASTGGQSYFDSAVSNSCAAREWILKDLADKSVVNNSKMPKHVTLLLDKWANVGKSLTPGGGTWLWGMLILVMGALRNKRWDIIVILGPALATLGTLLLGSPVATPFRYIAFAPIVTLFAFCAIFSEKLQRSYSMGDCDFS